MIKVAKVNEKKEIYDLWRAAFPTKSRAYMDFYFKHIFDKGTCLYLRQDEKVIATMQYQTHTMSLLGRKLLCSYITGVATALDYRRRGHMKYLMQTILDEVSHNHLITWIEAFNPKIYEPYGFQTVYHTRTYAIVSSWLEHVHAQGVSHSFTTAELVQLYHKFSNHFDGCYERDNAYYEDYVQKAKLDQGNICVYRNYQQQVTGYAVYVRTPQEVKVTEILYLESHALLKMLRFLSEGYEEISVRVSQSEKLEKLFPLAIAKKQSYTMIRINQYDLFNKLFQCRIQTPQEAFQLVKKPLFMNEEY